MEALRGQELTLASALFQILYDLNPENPQYASHLDHILTQKFPASLKMLILKQIKQINSNFIFFPYN